MLTEDYVSYETAKLLKEKGFDVYVRSYYEKNEYKTKEEFSTNNALWNYNISSFRYSAPTLQMAMKWLREVYNLHIEVYRTACGYLYIISKVPTGSDLYSNGDAYDGDDEDSGQWTTCEKAAEAAIRYCLENLI